MTKNKKISFFDTPERHIDLKLRIQYDGFKFSEFIRFDNSHRMNQNPQVNEHFFKKKMSKKDIFFSKCAWNHGFFEKFPFFVKKVKMIFFFKTCMESRVLLKNAFVRENPSESRVFGVFF